jgi:hypothetical protein
MKVPRCFLAFTLALSLWPGASVLLGDEIWVETVYFAEKGYKSDMQLPAPKTGWQVYARKKLFIGQKVQGVEELEGPEKGTQSWLLGNKVVTLRGGASPEVSDRMLGEASLWTPPTVDLSLFKDQKPVDRFKQDGQEVLVFETAQGFNRLWVLAESQIPLARVEGRFVKLYAKQKEDAPITAPDEAVKALEKEKKAERQLSKIGAMPAAE